MAHHRGSIRIDSSSLSAEDRRLAGLAANKFEFELAMRFIREIHVRMAALERRTRAMETAIIASPRRARD
jgi:hypothetical protein